MATRERIGHKIQVECLEQVVATSAVRHVRLMWVGTVCHGTVIGPRARSFCCLIHRTDDERRFSAHEAGKERCADLVSQGRAGAVAGLLLWCKPLRTWHWVPWPLLVMHDRRSPDAYLYFNEPTQSQARVRGISATEGVSREFLAEPNPDVVRVGDGGFVDFRTLLEAHACIADRI